MLITFLFYCSDLYVLELPLDRCDYWEASRSAFELELDLSLILGLCGLPASTEESLETTF